MSATAVRRGLREPKRPAPGVATAVCCVLFAGIADVCVGLEAFAPDRGSAIWTADVAGGGVAPEDALQFTAPRGGAGTLPARPRADSSLTPSARFKLSEGFAIARRIVSTEASCGAMFGSLGAAGTDALARTRYLGGGEVGACLRQVPAFTCVGCEQTVLCPGFSELGAAAAAVVLIHEALHQAGLPERPAMPGAMSSTEITHMVEANCAP